MKLRLSPQQLTEAGITDRTPEELTIGKMLEGIIETPKRFIIYDIEIYESGNGYVVLDMIDEFSGAIDFPSFPKRFDFKTTFIDNLFDAYCYVINY